MRRIIIKYIICCWVCSCAFASIAQKNNSHTADSITAKQNLLNKQQPQFLIYKKADTTTLGLYVYYPQGWATKTNHAAVIFFFGGGWVNGKITQFKKHAEYFASRGMVAVLADYRVASRHKTSPFDAVKDAKSAIRFLRTNYKLLHIETNKIVAGGGSAGGHLAAAADLTLLEEPYEDLTISSRPNALILFNPVFDNGPSGYGYERFGNSYVEISPMHNIKKGAAPAIVFFGTNDKYVPVTIAQVYKNKMTEAGSQMELLLYDNQPHGFFNSPAFVKETLRQADIFLTSLNYLEKK